MIVPQLRNAAVAEPWLHGTVVPGRRTLRAVPAILKARRKVRAQEEDLEE